MYKKKTLRHMQPITRQYARVINDLDSVLRRLKNLTEDVARIEADSRALFNRNSREPEIERETSLDNHIAKYLEEDTDDL